MDIENLSSNYLENMSEDYSSSVKYAWDCDDECYIIINPYDIKDDAHKFHFLEHDSIINIYHKDSDYNLYIQWKAHNILYNKKLFRKRTSHVRLCKKSKFKIFLYRLIVFIFNE